MPAAPWGQAIVRRAGTQATLVTYSRMVHYALEAANVLSWRRRRSWGATGYRSR